MPHTFTWRGTRHHIYRILNRWVVRTEWWRNEVARRYFKVECEGLGIYEIYQHESGWVLEREMLSRESVTVHRQTMSRLDEAAGTQSAGLGKEISIHHVRYSA